MNLLEAKKKALSLMAEYSVDGVLTTDGDNADYLNRMNRFANDAQMEISDKIGIQASVIYTQVGVSTDGFNKYDLPVDFKEFRYMNKDDYRFDNFRIENTKVLIPKQYDGQFELFYHKNPSELDSMTLDTYEFEVSKHSQHLIPYFMGGMVLQDENPMLSGNLMNMYYGKLQAIVDKNTSNPSEIASYYSM
jgi:hypothetical protein